MTRVPVTKAKRKLLELVRRAEAGDVTVIEKRGFPAAALVPYGEYSLLGRAKSHLAMQELAHGLRDCGLTAQGLARESRPELEAKF